METPIIVDLIKTVRAATESFFLREKIRFEKKILARVHHSSGTNTPVLISNLSKIFQVQNRTKIQVLGVESEGQGGSETSGEHELILSEHCDYIADSLQPVSARSGLTFLLAVATDITPRGRARARARI